MTLNLVTELFKYSYCMLYTYLPLAAFYLYWNLTNNKFHTKLTQLYNTNLSEMLLNIRYAVTKPLLNNQNSTTYFTKQFIIKSLSLIIFFNSPLSIYLSQPALFVFFFKSINAFIYWQYAHYLFIA